MSSFPANTALVAAPAGIAGLHYALKARLAVIAAAFPILATKTSTGAPAVYDFTLPPKLNGDAEQYPFFAVRARTGVDSPQGADQNATATIDIEIGTYSDTDDGVVDLYQIIDAIRADLNAQPAIQGTGYEHIGPLSWDVPFPQPRPEWLALVTTNWQIPRARRVEARNPEEG